MNAERPSDIATLSVDASVQRRIEEYAHAHGLAPAEVVRQAFEEYEAAHGGPGRPAGSIEGSAYEAFDRAGLIGRVRGTPGTTTDLATNPKHMEGFGRD